LPPHHLAWLFLSLSAMFWVGKIVRAVLEAWGGPAPTVSGFVGSSNFVTWDYVDRGVGFVALVYWINNLRK
jgi:hypothetical protein